MPRRRIRVKRSRSFEDKYGNIVTRRSHEREIEDVRLSSSEKVRIGKEKAVRLDESMSRVMERNMDNPDFIIDKWVVDTYWDNLTVKEREKLLDKIGIEEDEINDDIGDLIEKKKEFEEELEEKEEKGYPVDDLEMISERIAIINEDIHWAQKERLMIKDSLGQEWDELDETVKIAITHNISDVNEYHKKRCKGRKKGNPKRKGHNYKKLDNFKIKTKKGTYNVTDVRRYESTEPGIYQYMFDTKKQYAGVYGYGTRVYAPNLKEAKEKLKKKLI